MLERKTVIDQIEVKGAGFVQLRLGLVIMDNGVELSRRYHRTAFDPAQPEAHVDAQMASVNAHLVSMGELPVEAADIADIKAHFGLHRQRRQRQG